MQTFWLVVQEAGESGPVPVNIPVYADTFASAKAWAEAQSLVVLGTADGMAASCTVCPWRHACQQSTWNDRRGNQPPVDESEVLSVVHTCAACFARVLSTRDTEDALVIPDQCPRWNPFSEASQLCDGCRSRTKRLMESHPDFDHQMDLAGQIIASALDGETPREPLSPKAPVGDTPSKIVASILRDALTSECLPEATRAASAQQVAEWVEWMTLLWHRHETIDVRVYEFLLIFLDTTSRTQWAHLPITRRRQILARWEAIMHAHAEAEA